VVRERQAVRNVADVSTDPPDQNEIHHATSAKAGLPGCVTADYFIFLAVVDKKLVAYSGEAVPPVIALSEIRSTLSLVTEPCGLTTLSRVAIHLRTKVAPSITIQVVTIVTFKTAAP